MSDETKQTAREGTYTQAHEQDAPSHRRSFLVSRAYLTYPALLYLLHAALLTFGLAISSLFFNLAILALGFERSLVGLLNSLPVLVGGLLSLPLWWLVTRFGLRPALLVSALLNAIATLTVAIWPERLPLLAFTALTGPATVIFQVSSAPFMMRHSDDASRDLLFSLNAGINIGVAGLGSLVGGALPGLAAWLLNLAPQSGATYQATFAVAGVCLLASTVPLLLIRDQQPVSTPKLSFNKPSNRRNESDQQPQANAGKQTTGDRRQPTNSETQHHRADTNDWWRFILYRSAFLVRHIPEPWQRMIYDPWPVLRFMIVPALISCGAALLIPFLNLYFRQRYNTDDQTLGIIFAAINIATGLATLAAPTLSARFGKMGTVVLTQTLAIPCLLLLGIAPLLGMAIVVALIRGTLMNMASPLYDAYAMEQSAEDARPTVIGLINGAFAVGYIVSPSVSTFVQEHYGFTPLFYATAVCYAIAAICNYLLFVRNRRSMPMRKPYAERED